MRNCTRTSAIIPSSCKLVTGRLSQPRPTCAAVRLTPWPPLHQRAQLGDSRDGDRVTRCSDVPEPCDLFLYLNAPC